MKKVIAILFFFYVCFFGRNIFGQAAMDLKIINVIIKPINPKIGDQMVISYQVKNVGNQQIPKEAYSVSLKIDGELVSFDDETDALAPEQSVNYSKAAGSYHKQIEKKGVYNWEIKVKSKYKDASPKDNIQKGSIVVN